MNSFFVVLPSNVETGEFPHNTISHYFTPLPLPLTLEHGKWEVGVTSIIYPHSWFNVKKPWNKVTFFKINRKGKYVKRKRTITSGFYTKFELLQKINSLRNAYFKSKVGLGRLSKKLKIKLKKQEGITFHKQLSYLLGLTQKTYFNPRTDTKIETGESPVDLNIDQHLFYVYSDIVKETLVGNNYLPLLCIINNTERKSDSHVEKTFINPSYTDVLKNVIKNIKISICDEKKAHVKFESGKIVIVLHFKKKTK